MVAVRFVLLACSLCACGRFGFGSDGEGRLAADAAPASDQHLRTAPGWSIAPLVDLSGIIPYNASDYDDGDTLSNEPRYIAALYPPFAGALAVIAGRSVIELSGDGAATVHGYRPDMPNTSGPDNPSQATFAALGASRTGLWLSSGSTKEGDGLYLIGSTWAMTQVNSVNNTSAVALDPGGSYDRLGAPALYVGTELTSVGRQTATATAPQPIATISGEIVTLAVADDALLVTVDDGAQVKLDRIGPGPNRVISELTTAASLRLAEGATAAGLFAIRDNTELVAISPSDGKVTPQAWSADAAWVWRAVCAPRAGHKLAGQLIVLESNRTADQDRLLLVTPP